MVMRGTYYAHRYKYASAKRRERKINLVRTEKKTMGVVD